LAESTSGGTLDFHERHVHRVVTEALHAGTIGDSSGRVDLIDAACFDCGTGARGTAESACLGALILHNW
ncbi:hypothetical protein PFISCL1PPCAC_14562, partial [Pristionchus fissidentatus]